MGPPFTWVSTPERPRASRAEGGGCALYVLGLWSPAPPLAFLNLQTSPRSAGQQGCPRQREAAVRFTRLDCRALPLRSPFSISKRAHDQLASKGVPEYY
ncbi:hypothetical protein NDU88_004764 [Pleurodeles waltl]|uniref:Uncharacterized protein n=1 Tax=Pleurodeles waltl TaxID=8319 RepID=A0AAV7WVB9_PLEWA|nr:hypothetical protein NDU88_004764 [Pleurodeles waltl]